MYTRVTGFIFFTILVALLSMQVQAQEFALVPSTFVCWVYDGEGISYPSDTEQQCFSTTARARQASLRSCRTQSAVPGSCHVVTCNRCQVPVNP